MGLGGLLILKDLKKKGNGKMVKEKNGLLFFIYFDFFYLLFIFFFKYKRINDEE